MKIVLAPLALAAGPLTPLAAVPSYAAGETCNGLAATIVGTPGAQLVGTPGPDVVVTNGAARVDAGAGDDTICTTRTVGADTINYAVTVLAGDGDDLVDRRGDTDPLANGRTDLGAGANTVHGSLAGDLVSSKAGASDTIGTGDGADSVFLEYAAPTSTEVDAVDLGAGTDVAYLTSGFSTGLALTGGPDVDTLWIEDTPPAPWTLDAAAGQVRVGATPALAFGDFEKYRVFGEQRLDFVGSERAEELFVGAPLGTVAFGGGDDRLLAGAVKGRVRPSIDGGAGTDQVQLTSSRARLDVDLGRGKYISADGARGRLEGFEDALIRAERVSLVGTDGPDELAVVACRAVSVGGDRGADTIAVTLQPRKACNGTRPDLRGGAGDDTITGTRVADLITGGPGQDAADGRGGRDTCRSVEQRTSC